VLAMIAGGIFLYLTIRKVVVKQIDTSLITEKTIIQDQIEQSDTIPDFSATFGRQIEVKILNAPTRKVQILSDTVITDEQSGDDLPYRHIFFSGNTPTRKGYTISILQILTEKQELLKAVSINMLLLFISLFLISILINYLISRKLWSTFYTSVEKAGNYNISGEEVLDLPESDIQEFQQLNKVFERMTQKMRSDYLSLKEFNENASHEIQTPLAIIRSKMELLMQNKNLKKDSLDLIKSINEATTRLFKLNQGLLLISKIENQYFQETKKLSLRLVVETCLDNYKEIMDLKDIRVEIDASDPAFVEMNEVLAEVLISNILSNAVRYNLNKGFIRCFIDNHFIIVTNSGQPCTTDPVLLFRRFHKGSDNPQSVGLGLSIVKKISDAYNMKVTYQCTGNIHDMKLEYR
jgi:signal transduction histidine kinase